MGHKCAATSGYTSTIITEILCINSGAMRSGHAGSTRLSSLWEDLPQRPGPPLKGHAVTSLSWGASPATCAGFWNKCRSCYGLLPPYRLALAEPSVGSSSYLLFYSFGHAGTQECPDRGSCLCCKPRQQWVCFMAGAAWFPRLLRGASTPARV